MVIVTYCNVIIGAYFEENLVLYILEIVKNSGLGQASNGFAGAKRKVSVQRPLKAEMFLRKKPFNFNTSHHRVSDFQGVKVC